MKKIMIALLAIAVLFGFAACDNSSSTPDGGDDVVADMDFTYRAATEFTGLDFGKADAAFAAGTEVMKTGKYTTVTPADGGSAVYSADLSKNEVTYSWTKAGVADLQDEYVTITLKGVDMTSADAVTAGTKKNIMLTSYTYSFSKNTMVSSGYMEPFTGTVSGDIIGKVEITGLKDGAIDTTATSATAITVKAVGTPDEIIVFLPAEGSDVASMSYVGNSVDPAKFVEYINYLSDDYADNATLTSNASYLKYQQDTYSMSIYKSLTSLISASSNGFAAFVKNYQNAGYEGKFVYDPATCTVTVTYTNSTTAPVLLAKNTTLQYAIPVNGSITFTFTGKTGTSQTEFTATEYKISSENIAVYDTTALTTGNEYDDYQEIAVDVTGKMPASITLKAGTKNNDGSYSLSAESIPSGFSFGGTEVGEDPSKVTYADLTAVDVVTTVDAPVLPGTNGTAEKMTIAPLGEIAITKPLTIEA